MLTLRMCRLLPPHRRLPWRSGSVCSCAIRWAYPVLSHAFMSMQND